MKKAFYFIIPFFIQTSCSDVKKDFIEKTELDKMLSEHEYEILDTIPLDKSEILEVYQDQGALGGHKFHLLHKTGSLKYHFVLYPDTTEKIKRLEEQLD